MMTLRVSSVVLLLFCLQTTVLCYQYESSSSSLRCYQCVNVDISSDSFGPLNGKSDPSCGTDPSSSNTVTCPSNLNACGSLSGEITVSTVFGGSVTSKIQIRGCTRDDSDTVIGNCHTTNDLSNQLVGTLISKAAELNNARVQAEVCTCKWDLCTVCTGGVDVAGYCLKYWIIAAASAGLIGIVLLLITCCCCCCGCCGCCCCRKRRHGVVLATPVPYHTLAVIHSSHAAPLSIQSGDISGYENPMAGQAEGVGVDYTGPPPYDSKA